ncbi:hypothetical protein BLA60_26805 [Actinophytocola xinjiangensis]|uniref:PE family protein n=1 Tax=Actinophytocola xinjiangensis TaxID=485602 RepID=A0A7Z0WHS4_9PSEU|nr:hypothetical protein [Actinophytocola xinjiangensis]OLF07534.1 hypothetical protein BLA60_26805 [Actinophytocola xinjiangensis]
MRDDGPLGEAGHVITGSGGGGADGRYVFASLDALTEIAAKWDAIRAGIIADRPRLEQALNMAAPPADDLMSRFQAATLAESLTKAIGHNDAMLRYVDSYRKKLSAAMRDYTTTEEDNASQLRGIHVD